MNVYTFFIILRLLLCATSKQIIKRNKLITSAIKRKRFYYIGRTLLPINNQVLK